LVAQFVGAGLEYLDFFPHGGKFVGGVYVDQFHFWGAHAVRQM
jgi:hypothetical protein